jgi:hypothetical protein
MDVWQSRLQKRLKRTTVLEPAALRFGKPAANRSTMRLLAAMRGRLVQLADATPGEIVDGPGRTACVAPATVVMIARRPRSREAAS